MKIRLKTLALMVLWKMIVVLMMVLGQIQQLFDAIKSMFGL